jgi:hypothetical protein
MNEPLDPNASSIRRFVLAMLAYVALGAVASYRLSGRPRLVVWLVLALFAFRTVLALLKQRQVE